MRHVMSVKFAGVAATFFPTDVYSVVITTFPFGLPQKFHEFSTNDIY